MILFDFHNVVKLRDRPIGTKLTFLAVMYRILITHPLKVGPESIVLEQHWVTDVNVLEGHCECIRKICRTDCFAHGCLRFIGNPASITFAVKTYSFSVCTENDSLRCLKMIESRSESTNVNV